MYQVYVYHYVRKYKDRFGAHVGAHIGAHIGAKMVLIFPDIVVSYASFVGVNVYTSMQDRYNLQIYTKYIYMQFLCCV